MPYIIAIIIAIALLGALLEWIKDLIVDLFGWIGRHIPQILLVIVFFVLCSQVGVSTAVALYAVGALAYILWKNFRRWVARNNERALTEHLNRSCLKYGYMTHDRWKRALPDYVGKAYPESTSFYAIVDQFARDVEQRYIAGDEKLAWLDPAIHYLAQETAADVHQLAQVPSEGLRYTHFTPNEKLIYDAMENLYTCKKIGDKAMIQKIPLGDDAVRKDLGLREGVSIPEYYKTAYVIADELRDKRKGGGEDAMESEEFSLDDL